MAYTDIDKPTDYFNTKLYSGTGSSQAVTGVGFQPDWIWFKCRTQAQNHNLFDAIRGSNKIIQSSTANAEATSTALLTSFDSDGFTVNTDGGVNGSGQTYASWNWLASNTTASNSDGSITSTVSANTTSGFSIVSYTGTGSNATVGHGLSSAPRMILVKNRDTTNSWEVFHASMGATKVILLNRNEAEQTSSSSWNNTEPTSSVFSIGTAAGTNGSSNDLIAYCFAEKKGYSKFGSYTGNGSTDGTFVYTGFKPAFVIIKDTNVNNWMMHDNKRSPYNQVTTRLYANLLNVEDTGGAYGLDFLSNGMKMRTNLETSWNGSGRTYIYMAFAENPFVTSGGIPTTAR